MEGKVAMTPSRGQSDNGLYMKPPSYPCEADLQIIRDWTIEKCALDCHELLAFVRQRWSYADWGWRQRGDTYHISTGGWSGNESLISALEQNLVFWAFCWQRSERGGHYVFHVRPISRGTKK